jgi:hypothetical protein
MNWFRSRIRLGARMALFALAFQMAVSFGHVHRDDLGLPPLPASEQTPDPSAASSAIAINTPAQPNGQNHQPASDDYCAICASMALVATALPSVPPLLITPAPIPRVWPPETRLGSISTEVTLPFQARAPPLG